VIIRNAADDSVVATISITDASQVSFSGSTLTINPTANLTPGTHYYVTMASGVVQDLAGNAYAGLAAATDFDFTTVAPDTTPPTLVGTTPTDQFHQCRRERQSRFDVQREREGRRWESDHSQCRR